MTITLPKTYSESCAWARTAQDMGYSTLSEKLTQHADKLKHAEISDNFAFYKTVRTIFAVTALFSLPFLPVPFFATLAKVSILAGVIGIRFSQKELNRYEFLLSSIENNNFFLFEGEEVNEILKVHWVEKSLNQALPKSVNDKLALAKVAQEKGNLPLSYRIAHAVVEQQEVDMLYLHDTFYHISSLVQASGEAAIALFGASLIVPALFPLSFVSKISVIGTIFASYLLNQLILEKQRSAYDIGAAKIYPTSDAINAYFTTRPFQHSDIEALSALQD